MREFVRHSEHGKVRSRHRLYDLLAGLASTQPVTLKRCVARQYAAHPQCIDGFRDLGGVQVVVILRYDKEVRGDLPSRWLTCSLLNPSTHSIESDTLVDALGEQDIETRLV